MNLEISLLVQIATPPSEIIRFHITGPDSLVFTALISL